MVIIGGIAFNTKALKPKFTYFMADLPVIGSLVADVYKLTARQKFEKRLDQAFAPQIAPEQYKRQFMNSLMRISQLKAAARDEITIHKSVERMHSQYGSIKVPVVIMTGDLDQIVSPSEQSFRLHEAIPQSTLIVIQHDGHELQFAHPDKVMEAIDSVCGPPHPGN
jgi:pimeloyl-ACP methyl ester carboxylesterase